MKYFYDTEFIEDGKTIDLISIGIVAEDGREYYAISKEFNPKKASQWVKDNVLNHLPPRKVNPMYDSPRIFGESKAWKSRQQIREDIITFVGEDKPELWAYYADYDHVALCQLFGTMMNLPKHFPKYTRDIKQLCDDKGNPRLPEQGKGEHHALADARWAKTTYEFLLKETDTTPTQYHQDIMKEVVRLEKLESILEDYCISGMPALDHKIIMGYIRASLAEPEA